ncbi:hypothetical protein DYL59_08460 [Pseudomonas kairouanensis]|uniref:Uncharacterized protein n=2 Tax=Pseudomonas kairouanensis TaxID=2293832 RepID=A0A4Z0AUS7_9PSED|nr:hypothetical protein DYL59_08460 [Pseudomonas kairouanensis]
MIKADQALYVSKHGKGSRCFLQPCLRPLTLHSRAKPTFEFAQSQKLMIENDGGSLDAAQLQVGQSKSGQWNACALVRNVPTRVTMVFQPVRGKLESIPALKIRFRSLKGEDNVVKFSGVAIN